ncbi:KTSC domain-containing protein [Clostridium sp.]|uniref:KTSC domain-containing protein n=1 Tax=Clostridium sp. TaxID=1506 RepID=UPI0039946B56
MNMISVISSNLIAVGYDETTMTLRIQFTNGTYDYFNVPSNVYEQLMTAPSKGSYHNRFIKNSYSYKRIG